MSNVALGLLNGLVIQTDVGSITGKYLYSDYAYDKGRNIDKSSALNTWTKYPLFGIAAGIVRVALGIIHTIGHLFAALFTLKKGHLFHAAKGACEILRGCIETTPIIGRIFANKYPTTFHVYEEYTAYAAIEGPYTALKQVQGRSWWMIKIYNPNEPDGLDLLQVSWKEFPANFKFNFG